MKVQPEREAAPKPPCGARYPADGLYAHRLAMRPCDLPAGHNGPHSILALGGEHCWSENYPDPPEPAADGDLFSLDPERVRRVAHELFLETRPMVESCEKSIDQIWAEIGTLRLEVSALPHSPADVAQLARDILAVLGARNLSGPLPDRVEAVRAICHAAIHERENR